MENSKCSDFIENKWQNQFLDEDHEYRGPERKKWILSIQWDKELGLTHKMENAQISLKIGNRDPEREKWIRYSVRYALVPLHLAARGEIMEMYLKVR